MASSLKNIIVVGASYVGRVSLQITPLERLNEILTIFLTGCGRRAGTQCSINTQGKLQMWDSIGCANMLTSYQGAFGRAP